MEKRFNIYLFLFSIFITGIYGTVFVLFDEYLGNIYYFIQNYILILSYYLLLFYFFLRVKITKKYTVVIFTITVVNFFIANILIYYYQEYFSLQNVIDIFPDSQRYDYNGKYISNFIVQGNFNLIDHLKPYWTIADMGYIIIIGIIYSLSDNNIFAGILINLPFLVLNILFIYKISVGLFGDRVGRTAGILAAFYPYFLFYSGVLLKETIMISIVLSFFYLLSSYHNSRTRKNFFILILPIVLLFFFRTFLAVILVASLSFYFFQKSKKALIFFLVIIGTVFVFFPALSILKPFLMRLEFGYLGEMKEMMMRGYAVDVFANLPMLVLGSLLAPFPSLVTATSYLNWSSVVANGAIIKASLTYFAIWGTYMAYKGQNAVSKTILFFVLLYVGALVYSSEIFNHRFSLIYQPFLIIFISLGLYSKHKYNKTGLLFLYLTVLALTIIYFNYTKLSIRL